MRITFDTNILISSFITAQGIASRVLLRSIEEHEVCLSEHILDEFKKNLLGKLRYPPGLVDVFLKFLASRTQLIPENASIPEPRFADATDIPILRLLETAGIHYLVTGDKKLLGLKKHKQTLILSLREALELL